MKKENVNDEESFLYPAKEGAFRIPKYPMDDYKKIWGRKLGAQKRLTISSESPA